MALGGNVDQLIGRFATKSRSKSSLDAEISLVTVNETRFDIYILWKRKPFGDGYSHQLMICEQLSDSHLKLWLMRVNWAK